MLQMKERCTYMQEVNNLCKEVEEEAGSPSLSRSMDTRRKSESISVIPELTEEEEIAELEGRDDEFEKSRKISSASTNSADMDPKLVELATEVKDLNARFANTCMQAKDHYAALSKALTASFERQSSAKLKTSTSDSVVRRKKSHRASGSGSPKKNRKSLSNLEVGKEGERNEKLSKRRSCIEVGFHPPTTARMNSSEASASANTNTAEVTDSSGRVNPDSGLGVGHIPRDSVVLADKGSSPANWQRIISLNTGTDLSKEGTSASPCATPVEPVGPSGESSSSSASSSPSKVVLRRKVNQDSYSDNQPRQKKRPKSALIIEANPDRGTAVLSEVQLRDGNSQRQSSIVRRRSIEVDYSALAKTGLLFQGSTPNSPALGRSRNRVSRRLGTQPRDRSSIASIESLDPRAIMMFGGGDVERSVEYHNQSFETSHISTTSDITCSTTNPVPDYVLEQRFGMWKGVVENGLSTTKRSMSVDVLATKDKQSEWMEGWYMHVQC